MINRYNYEEFFLLYLDKELDAEGRMAVEAFVSQNPDLAKELELLGQVLLADDYVPFVQKEVLYKKENGISLTNYEEYFLLLADNELDEQQAVEVESFVLKHPRLQNEFTILQQTRLQPQLIEFKGKEKLYRKEKKVIRIIPLMLIRMGAAAAIAGVTYMSYTTFFYKHNSKSTDSNTLLVATEKPIEKAEKNNAVTEKPVIEEPKTEKTAVSSISQKTSKKKYNTNCSKQEKAG